MRLIHRLSRRTQALSLLGCLALSASVLGCARTPSEPSLQPAATSDRSAIEVRSTSTIPTLPTTTPIVIPLTPILTPSATSTTVPPSPTKGIPTPTRTSTTHTVQAGDTLAKIAAQYGTSVDAIVEANNIEDRNLIWVGQKLIIP